MSRSRPTRDAGLRQQLDEVVQRLAATRRTFTEEEVFAKIWEAGYEVSPQVDARFVPVSQVSIRGPRHWHLAGQVVANNRLIEALEVETWDGRNLDAELARMDQEWGGHNVFCPADERLFIHPDGRVDLADGERDVALPPEVQTAVDALAGRLLERWRAVGPVPWTVRQVTEALGEIGWERVRVRGAWFQVRQWLRTWPAAARVGRDYWLPADAIPTGPTRTRLAVVRVRGADPTLPRAGQQSEEATPPTESPGMDAIPTEMTTPTARTSTRWTTALRTVNLLEGFLTVPVAARAAYPPTPRGGGRWEVVRGQWFETGEPFWVWLDRERNLLCGPELADRLAWREAGERFEIVWAEVSLVFRPAGMDAEVQREETRLADAETLTGLRGGLGESYRQSIAAILAEQRSGLPFRDLLGALRERQGHDVHRGTLRAILHAGGFRFHEGRWYIGQDEGQSKRSLREAVVLSLGDQPTGESPPTLRTRLIEVAASVADRCRVLRLALQQPGKKPNPI